MPSSVLERFELLDLLGRGGMAEVYRANDKALGRQVAVKLLDSKRAGDGELRQRLVREARAAAALKLDTVVQVHDIDPSGRFIVMELVQGESLAQRVTRGPLPATEVRRVATALLGALGAAHQLGIVHRDVKPSNVLLDDSGSVKLADFGVARVADGADLTESGAVVGTVSYMAPEQLRGAAATVQSDLYSAGVTLFEAATGARFHDGEGAAHPDPVGAVLRATGDRALAESIARAVSSEPSRRFGSAAQFLSSLQRRHLPLRGIAAVVGACALAAVAWLAGPQLLRSEEDRLVDEGLTAFAEHRLEEASIAFRRVQLKNPENATGAYHLALITWWLDKPAAEVDSDVRRALRTPITDVQRGVLEGIRLLEVNDFPAARDFFEALAKQHPNDRDVVYCLFEARFHGGAGAEAVEAHARLRSLDPDFHLGEVHALSWWLAHGELGPLTQLTARLEARNRDTWRARVAVARRQLDEAAALYDAMRAEHPRDDGLTEARFQIALLALEPNQAEALAARVEVPHALHLLLATARGDEAGAAAAREKVIATLQGRVEFEQGEILRTVVLLEAARPGDGDAATLLARLKALSLRFERGLRLQLAEVFLHARLGASAEVATYTKSPYPEVAAVARALTAPRPEDAMAHWREAIAASNNGEYLSVEHWHLARAAVASGDDAAALAACDRALHPTVFAPGWAQIARPCLALSAAAAQRAGQPREPFDAQLARLEQR